MIYKQNDFKYNSNCMRSNQNQSFKSNAFPKHNCDASTSSYTLCRFIPKGHKVLLTFHYNTCTLTFIKSKHKTPSTMSITLSFHPSLCIGSKGTVVFGSLFYVDNIKCFTIEDVYVYKSNTVKHKNWQEKEKLIHEIMGQIKQEYFNKKSIVIGLCVSRPTKDKLLNLVHEISYPIYAIQNIYTNYYKIERFKPEPIHIFTIKSDILPDIYHMYKDNTCIGQAYIPDYKTSVMMNQYFRNIKENNNLDALEESDDEEEFENDALDKYVDMKKSLDFKCKYNKTFHLWVPLELHATKSS